MKIVQSFVVCSIEVSKKVLAFKKSRVTGRGGVLCFQTVRYFSQLRKQFFSLFTIGFAFKSFNTFGFCSSTNVSLNIGMLNVRRSFETLFVPHLTDPNVVGYNVGFAAIRFMMLDLSDGRQTTRSVYCIGREEVMYRSKIKVLYVP